MKKHIYLLILILLGSIQGFSQDMTKMTDEEIIKKSKEIVFNYINTDSFFTNNRVDNNTPVYIDFFNVTKEYLSLHPLQQCSEGDRMIAVKYYRYVKESPRAVIFITLKNSKVVSKMRGTDGMGLDITEK
ncbi:hypothetical protein [Myroides profundi]|uniref:Uncharacterized protein n=1 Tax=Myroides profundi TaxID=480520 RepID=A0AAJ4W1Z2_MYRPR|nr:hypothetical protein [Myroides profundi]AJH14991.1 hypothetical protein MPR_1811 [Myroides profundi]SEQ31408.1 hypothetical protein SAMN04488089_102309 [Myroides profundi]